MKMNFIASRLLYLVTDGHVQCKKKVGNMPEEEIISSLFIMLGIFAKFTEFCGLFLVVNFHKAGKFLVAMLVVMN